MVADREAILKVTVGHVPPQTHVVINMRKAPQDSLHHTASKREGMIGSLLSRGVIHVEGASHMMEPEPAGSHVIVLPPHSLADMDPEEISTLSSARAPPQGHGPIPKDVRAVPLNDVVDLKKEMVLPAAQAGPPADQMSHAFARIAEALIVVWHNVPCLRRMSFLIGAVNCVPPNCYTGPLLITS